MKIIIFTAFLNLFLFADFLPFSSFIDIKNNKTIVDLEFNNIEQRKQIDLIIDSNNTITFSIDKYIKREDGFKLTGKDLNTNSSLLLTMKKGYLYGNITISDISYIISPFENNYYQIIKDDKSRVSKIDSKGVKNPNKKTSYLNKSVKQKNFIISNSNQLVEIDLLILYTQEMKDFYGDSLESLIQNYVDLSNEVLENSLVNVKLNLKKISLYDNFYAKEFYTIETALNQITYDSNVKALKRMYDIDMISLFRKYDGYSSSCGLGYILNELSEYSASYSYTVVEISTTDSIPYYCSNTTFMHELGHNFGCDHDRNHSSLDGLYSYSYGYDISNEFATIMSYDSPTINYFSNPNIQYNGNYIGLPEGLDNSADCSRTINNSKVLISNHKLPEDLEIEDSSNNNGISGILSSDLDRDLFSFSLSGFINFQFNLSGYFLNIYDEDQKLVYSSDRDFRQYFNEDTIYYLVVSSSSDNGLEFYSGSEFSYDITISSSFNNKVVNLTDKTAFIERFYQNILNRTADTGGMNTWLNTIQNESATKVALGFFNSQEFVNLNLSNEEFVDILYQTLFDRQADSGGRTYWINKLNANTSKDEVMYGFFNGTEFKNLSDSYGVTAIRDEDQLNYNPYGTSGVNGYVNRFYTLVLNRTPDDSGFNDWTTQLNAGTKGGGDIAKGFFNSQEYLNRNLDNSTFLDICYQAFFDREADSGGKSNWTTLLNQGGTKEQVLDGFIDSQEFINLANTFGIANRLEN